MAEAERTQDQELADEFGDDNDNEDSDSDGGIDAAPALLTGFDSDNEDTASDKDLDTNRVAPIPQYKKTSKKLRKAKETKSDGPGVVYIGRIPHGFYETQMKEYFAQFGEISRLRLSRNKKTGASKHFAFIEFQSDEVAKIVAETMDNYLMFGHILKCKYAPAESLHADVWKGANKKFRKIPHHKLAREKAEQPKTVEQMEKKVAKEQKKRASKAKKLQALGYEYELPEIKMSDAPVQIPEEKQAALEEKVEGAIVPPANMPKDELAAKVEADVKEAKQAKKGKKVKQVTDPVVVEAEQKKKKSEKRAAESELEPVEKVIKPKKMKSVDSSKTDSGKKEKKPKSILKKPTKA